MMRIEKLYLRNFRNYSECLVEFAPGINWIHGNNAQGKTSLLEALYLMMTGRSFRTTHLQDLIQFGASSFAIDLLFEKQGTSHQLQMYFDGKEKKVLLDGTPLPAMSELLGLIHGVLITPEDDALIKGAPKIRRTFLDLHIAKTDPLYLQHLARYTKAMRHRNALLKDQATSLLHPFEETMATSANYIASKRKLSLEQLEQAIDHQPEHISLIYKPNLFSREHLERELILGTTATGPHREDFTPLVGEREARHFGSEGQKRSCVAALKLAQFKTIEAITGETPLLCIDDVGISFDREREKGLLEKVATFKQVFLTACHPLELEGHRLHVESGQVEMPTLQPS